MDPHGDEKLDETIAETFPASDAPANTVETGIRIAPDSEPVIDNAAKNRFELTLDGHIAYLTYERSSDTMTLVHTEVPDAIRGRQAGGRLVDAGVAAAHAAGLRLSVVCPFARAYLKQHPR